ncbi:unnamed protein product [Brassicogethes aeneus]|uniref:Uncharacterized protein n=1 Tax=Brassicogethes aeneus TaxID=1431903 RepID=A0A9P0FPJ1_BRAAE|nr:unnamed protein product [Brassicogethes aeneus]
MEPAAPGTEDEIPYTAGLTKQANEEERLLNLKAFLPNGQYGRVFELNYLELKNNGTQHWFCNACKCPVMGRVYQHELGKRHCINMARGHQREGDPAAPPPPTKEDHHQTIQVAPGEPLPPGFEGQVEETTLIQEKLDNFQAAPLVALEYLLELQHYDPSKEPFYLCVLCDKKGDPRTVLTHLSSYNHIQSYLQKHFPTCYRKLAPYMTKQYKRGFQRVLVNIAEAIEHKFGRMKPVPIEKDKFEADVSHYLAIIMKSRHFTEKTGHTFEELVQHEELTKVYYEAEVAADPSMAPGVASIAKPFKKRSPSPPVVARPVKKTKQPPPSKFPNPKQQEYQRKDDKNAAGSSYPANPAKRERKRSLSSVSSISSNEDIGEWSGKYVKNKDRKQPPPKRNDSKPQFQRRNEPPPQRDGPMPWQKSNYIRSQDKITGDRGRDVVRNDKVDEFKKLSKAIENDMGKSLLHHEKNPEKHPQYNDEWKKFWNKRYKELQAEGKDAANFDFKPEWIQFWNKRMIELHQEEIKLRKDALRKRLGLPEEPAPICFRITGKGKDGSKDSPKDSKPMPMAARPDNEMDDEVIVIEDDKYVKHRDDKYNRSQSPWESEPVPRSSIDRNSRERRLHKNPSPARDRRRDSPYSKRSKSRDRYSRTRDRSRSKEKSMDKPEYREKGYRESSYERDVRGKDRVRTVADLPWEREKYYEDYYKPPPVMRDVTRKPMILPPARTMVPPEEEEDDGETASLIHLAGERQKDQQSKMSTKVTPVSVPGVGTVDKAAIARQIASALIAQGKTDVTQDQLEQLINAVVGMAEASKKAGKPISTQSFLDKLSGNSAATEPTVEKKEVASLDKITEPLTPSPKSSSQQNMDHLSDSDLQTLLQNFKDLQTDEQHGLINYLKKLESHEPERVERLRKFVNLKPTEEEKPKAGLDMKGLEDVDDFEDEEENKPSGRESPFSNRLGGLNPTADEKSKEPPAKIQLDSEDEEYSFEDVVKAASKNVKAKELEKERQIVEESMKKTKDIVDAQSIISNLMSNFSKNKTAAANVGASSSSNSASTSSMDFSGSLSGINMENIANIVGNAQKMLQDQQTSKRNEEMFQSQSTSRRDEFLEDFPPVASDSFSFEPPSQGTSSPSKPHIISNIVLNRIDRSNAPQSLGPSRPSFEPNRPDLQPARSSMNSNGSQMSMGPRMGMQQGPRMVLPRPQLNNGPSGNQQQQQRGNYPPMGNNSYGNNFQPNNYPSQQQQQQQQQQNVAYPNMRGNNSNFEQRPRYNNPRFQGNQFNSRPSGNYNNNNSNRW